MKFARREFALLLVVLAALVGALSSPYSPVSGSIGAATISTPTFLTSTTFNPTVTTTLSTTSSTTATSISVTTESTSTSTTSTFTSFSYTSTFTTTTTQRSTFTSLTNTVTSIVVTLTTVVASSSQTSTSIVTQASTTTIAKFPGCLIATATFGSELSPEVQLLRGFRDDSILKTSAGSGFMVAFNAWYYSFSPTVANYLLTHPTERTIMKGVLYPLIGILKLSSLTYSVTGAFPELAALLSGLVASSLIGTFYLGLPLSLLRTKIRRLQGRRVQPVLEKALAAGLLSGIVALIVGEILGSPIILVASSVTIVLSTLFLSAAVTSARISRKLQAQ